MGGKAGNIGGIGNRPGVVNWKPPGGFGGGMGGGSVPPVTGGPLPPFNPGQMPPQGMRPTGGGIGQPMPSDNSGGQPWVSAGQPNPSLLFGRFRPRGF